MLVALSYHTGDRDSAVLLAEWIAELGGCKGHRLLLLRDRGADPIPAFADSFDSVNELVVTTDSWHRWPESANNAFRTAAKHLQFTTPEPWLWIEPDCVPLKPGWVDAIEAEYKDARKPFLGARVPPFKDAPEHMSGVAVYPGRLVEYAGLSLIAYDTPWDVQAAGQIRRVAHWTKLVQHKWKHPSFESIEQVRSVIDHEAVLFHASKDGSLIRLLRENLSGGVESRHANSNVRRDAPGQTGLTASADGRGVLHSGSSAPPAQNTLPVPVLAEPDEKVRREAPGEARESTKKVPDDYHCQSDSRGGQNLSETGNETPHALLSPWQSSHESIERIKSLCAELKRYCTAPRYISIVRDELNLAGIVKRTTKKRRSR